jgi:tetratricopeptide (TPR) repeat protein
MPDAEEAVRLTKEIGDPKLLAQALSNLGATLQWRAAFGRGLAYLHEGAELAQRAHSGFDFARAAFHIGLANTAKGEYEEALRWFRQLSDYASAAGDKFFLARVPNCIGGVHLEVCDLDAALRLNLEGAEAAQQYWPWPEPHAHALLKVGLAHFERGDHGRAEEFFRRTWALLEGDIFLRWRWHIPLLRARGQLALVEGRYDQAWTYATQSLEMAIQTDARKHVARAQRLQGDILAACGQCAEAVQTFQASIYLAERLQTPRELWQGRAALGKVLLHLGQEKDAEASFSQVLQTIEAIAANLQTPSLRQSVLHAAPVLEVYDLLGHRPPPVTR